MAVYFFMFLTFFFFSDYTAPQTYIIPKISGSIALDSYLPDQFFLGQIGYTSDISFSETEFHYLMGIKAGIVDRHQLEQGLYAVRAKGIFETVVLDIEHEDDEYNLVVCLHGAWIIKRIVRSSSPLIQRFCHYYDLAIGDCFDQEKHDQALQKIEQQTHKRGYLNSRVSSTIARDPTTKSVTVMLDIQLYDQFHINSCKVTIADQKQENLAKSLEMALNKKWQKGAYRAKVEQKSIDFITDLLAKKGFFNPQIELSLSYDYEHAAVSLLFQIDLKQGYAIACKGNQAITTAELFDYIWQQSGGGLVPRAALSSELQALYHARGYFDAAVQVEEQDQLFCFVIHEGNRASITGLQIEGMHALDRAWVTTRFFAASTAGHYYDQERVTKGVERLRSYYERQGFIDAHVNYEPRVTGSSCALIITVQEGKSYKIGTVTYEPPELVQKSTLPSIASMPFYAERIAEHKQLLLDALRVQGYLYARVEPCCLYHDEQIDICWRISPGPIITFGKTILQGPSWLDMAYIMPRLPYKEGEPFSFKSVEQAVEAIRSLQVCDTIHICPDQQYDQHEQPILLKLTPDDPFEIRCRFGIAQVSTNFTFRPGTTYAVGGSFIYKNPLQRADQLRLDFDITRFEHTSSAQYLFPLRTKLPLSGLIKGYDAFYQQPLFPGSDQSLYTIIQRGVVAGVTLGYKSLTVGLNYGIEWERISNVCGVCACALDFQPTLLDTNIPSVIIESTLLSQYENDQISPSVGSTTLLSLKGVMPLYTKQAATGFIRFLFEQAGFVRVAPGLSLAGRMRAGHVFNQFFRSILPPDRFYLGGAYSVRGYNNDLVPPLSLVEHGNCCVWVPRGGRSMINLNLELRLDVGRYMVVALFQDGGALGGDGFHNLHWVGATGGGIRFKTPIGIVRFDIGFKWKRIAHESCCAWFLTLGNPF